MLGFILVGLLEIIVKELCDWVCSVIINFCFEFLVKCIMVNLVLVDLFKEGGCFDLLIVFGILVVLD